MAFGRSGRLYVDLAGANQVAMISRTGQTLARSPSPVNNTTQRVPFDSPLGMAFQGDRLLIANSAFLSGSSSSWAVLTFAVGERGVAQPHPDLGQGAEPSLKLVARPARAEVGRPTQFLFTVSSMGGGRHVRGALITFAGNAVRTDRAGRAAIVITPRQTGRLLARAVSPGYFGAHAAVRVLRTSG
jgi:hypothetical protein